MAEIDKEIPCQSCL